MKNETESRNRMNFKKLFESQACRNAFDYYLSTLENPDLPVWDYVILTASNEAQAKMYEMQMEHRIQKGQLPQRTEYVVIPDPGGQRVGSGGATLSCIKYVMEHEGTLKGRRILVIHSGGDSKRIPQYSVCGKLFSPVPRDMPGGMCSTLFDEIMVGMTAVAPGIIDGMLVCSGDVLLIFDAFQTDFRRKITEAQTLGAAAFSIKENAETGKNHGTYIGTQEGLVKSFLHKQTVKTLREKGAIDPDNNVNIDTGAVIFNSDVLNALYGLISTDEDYKKFVNGRARLSFYADFLYPLAYSSTLEGYYVEKPEGDFTGELKFCRTALWKSLHKYRMKLIPLSPASFIHFGTTKELLKLMTDSQKEYAVNNSYVSKKALVGADSFIEDSCIHRHSRIGKGCIISEAELDGVMVPDNAVLHVLKQNSGQFVCRMYGVEDNPKEKKLFGRELAEFGLDETLWTARIYPVCDTAGEAVRETLKAVREMLEGDSLNTQYLLTSLKDSFNNADVTAIIPWQEKIRAQTAAEALLDKIEQGVPADEIKKEYPALDKRTEEYLLKKAEKCSVEKLDEFEWKIRIYGYLSKLTDSCRGGDLSDKPELTGGRGYSALCFENIAAATLKPWERIIRYRDTYRFTKDATVNLPVRINFGGGWSDTPPYCLINGGTVLNAAVKLNGSYPIEATVRRIETVTGAGKPVIILASTDNGSRREFDRIEELQDCRKASDPFALHKAALIACGVIPYHEKISVEEICSRLSSGSSFGGGFYMNTCAAGIPRGSGLGTSSILAGACVKAIFQALGTEVTDDEVFFRVLCMEQLMSTGGGWQDQVGGIVPGIKMVKTEPGLKQKVTWTKCNIKEETIKELNERLALIYTGQRRLARNLLRDVVIRYITNDKDSVEAHCCIRKLAVQMQSELEKGSVDGFAELLNKHWKESRRIDSDSSNACIDLIFRSIDDLICGRMICGAGGGGFLQVVMKRGESKEKLRKRLAGVFPDGRVSVWDCEFV